jgi:hypothetical protein
MFGLHAKLRSAPVPLRSMQTVRPAPKHDPKARDVSRIDHFAYIKDDTTLLAAQELGILGEAQKTRLEKNLDLRNCCGCPGNYKPGEKEVSCFIEDLVTIAF